MSDVKITAIQGEFAVKFPVNAAARVDKLAKKWGKDRLEIIEIGLALLEAVTDAKQNNEKVFKMNSDGVMTLIEVE